MSIEKCLEGDEDEEEDGCQDAPYSEGEGDEEDESCNSQEQPTAINKRKYKRPLGMYVREVCMVNYEKKNRIH